MYNPNSSIFSEAGDFMEERRLSTGASCFLIKEDSHSNGAVLVGHSRGEKQPWVVPVNKMSQRENTV